MDLESDLAIIKIFDEFKSEKYDKLEQDLFNRYSNDLKTLTIMIEHLEKNDIKEDDINIQLDLDYYLTFLSSIEDKEILQLLRGEESRELIILKLVKQKLTILNKIKNNELEYVSSGEDEIKRIQVKKYITTKELSKIWENMSIETQKRRRARLLDPLPHFREGRKIMYEREKIEEWLKNQD